MTNLHLRGSVLWRDNTEAKPQWRNGEVFVVDGRLTTRKPESGPVREIDGYVVPGLCDVHAHIGIDSKGYCDTEDGNERMLQQGRQQLAAGVVAIRDCGSPADNRDFQADPTMPRLIRCGRHLARPKRYIRGLGLDMEDPHTLPEEIVHQAKRGDGWVKIVGDWIDRDLGAQARLRPLWEREILLDAVAAAHENGARVTVHTFSHDAIDDLLEAGVDCIEHGTGMDADQISEAARRGIPVTPTLLQVALFSIFAAQGAAKFPEYAKEMNAMWERRFEQVAAFVDAGVQLLPGTDSGGYQEHGCLPAEFELWRQVGLSDAQILDAASWRCRDYLGLDSLSEAAPADFVIYREDPSLNIATVAEPVAVYRDGQEVFKTGN